MMWPWGDAEGRSRKFNDRSMDDRRKKSRKIQPQIFPIAMTTPVESTVRRYLTQLCEYLTTIEDIVRSETKNTHERGGGGGVRTHRVDDDDASKEEDSRHASAPDPTRTLRLNTRLAKRKTPVKGVTFDVYSPTLVGLPARRRPDSDGPGKAVLEVMLEAREVHQNMWAFRNSLRNHHKNDLPAKELTRIAEEVVKASMSRAAEEEGSREEDQGETRSRLLLSTLVGRCNAPEFFTDEEVGTRMYSLIRFNLQKSLEYGSHSPVLGHVAPPFTMTFSSSSTSHVHHNNSEEDTEERVAGEEATAKPNNAARYLSTVSF